MAVIICMPTVGGLQDNFKTEFRGYYKWNQFLKRRLSRLCREYHCAFVDLTMKTVAYNDLDIKNWSVKESNGEYGVIHPNLFANASFMSELQNLVYPVGLWNLGEIAQGGADDLPRYSI
jgi:hypothetical protein